MCKRRTRTAKSAVMIPEYRSRVERDKTKYSKHDRKSINGALKKGLYFIWERGKDCAN